MLRKKIFLLLIPGLLFCQTFLWPQIRPGAKQAAVSQSDIAAPEDIFSSYFNPAASGMFHTSLASFYFAPAPYGLSELKQFGVHAVVPYEGIRFSAGLYNYGFKLYNETCGMLNAAYSPHRNFTFGINITGQNLHIERYGNSFAFRLDAGAIFSLSQNLNIGLSGTNITANSYSGSENSIPRILRTSVSYSPVSELRISSMIEAEENYDPALKMGIVVHPHQNLFIRGGYGSLNKEVTAGLSIFFAGISFDYGFSYHRYLGASHFTGVSLPDVTAFF